jgi:hypothetical protein
MGISPRSTFTSCGSSFEPANNQGARVVAQRSRCDPVLMRNVRCGKIDRDLVPEVQQSLAEMGTYESCASGDENAAVAKHLLVSPLQEGITLRRACPAGSITANEVRANVKLRCMIKYDKVGPLATFGRGLEVLPGDSGPKNSAGWPAGSGPPGSPYRTEWGPGSPMAHDAELLRGALSLDLAIGTRSVASTLT